MARILSLDLSCNPDAPASTRASGSETLSSSGSHLLSTPRSEQDACHSQPSTHASDLGWEQLLSSKDTAEWSQSTLNAEQSILPQAFVSDSSLVSDLTCLPSLQFDVELSPCCPSEPSGPIELLDTDTFGIHLAPSTTTMPLPLWESLERTPITTSEGTESQGVVITRRVSVRERTIFQHLQSVLGWRPNLESLLHPSQSEIACDQLPDKRVIYDRVDACYRDPQGIWLFLERMVVDSAIDQVFEKSSDDTTLRTLVSAINGLGIWYQGIECTDSGSKYLADCCKILESNLGGSGQIVFTDQSLLALQAQLVLVHLSSVLTSRHTAGFLAFATHHARSLGLHSDHIIVNRFPRFDDQQHVRRALWFLFTAEKSFCMRENAPSFLSYEAIDHSVDGIANPSLCHKWLTAHHEYALICSSLLSVQFCEGGPTDAICQEPESFNNICQRLSKWKSLLPYNIDNQFDLSGQADKVGRESRLVSFIMYHEAMLNVFMAHKDCETAYKSVVSSPDKILQESKRSAIAVLKCSSYLEHEDVLRHPVICRVVCVAFCVILESIRREGTQKQDLAYLVIAAGFFGKISLLVEVSLTEITELLRLAQQRD